MSSFAPNVHSVQFYESHEALIDRLCGVVCSGLLVGNSVLIVATEAHRKQLATALQALQVDVRSYVREERLAMFDATQALSRFMVKGMPDAKRFEASICKLVSEAKDSSRSDNQGLTVFGEMVAVLWEQGNKAGALALERLWNNLLNERAFHLHCAYPRALFKSDQSGMWNICETHTHVLDRLAPAA